eukprot:2974321-Pyramimonas_sp.AAC.1
MSPSAPLAPAALGSLAAAVGAPAVVGPAPFPGAVRRREARGLALSQSTCGPTTPSCRTTTSWRSRCLGRVGLRRGRACPRELLCPPFRWRRASTPPRPRPAR